MVICPEQEIDGIKVRDWSTYLGRSGPLLYDDFSSHGANQTQNLLLFVDSFLAHLLYRKVWSWGGFERCCFFAVFHSSIVDVILASNNPSAQPAEFFITAQQICSILNIGLQFVLMLFSFYLIRIDGAKKIHQMKKQSQAPDDFHKMLAAKAAPSWIGIILMIVALFLLSLPSCLYLALICQRGWLCWAAVIVLMDCKKCFFGILNISFNTLEELYMIALLLMKMEQSLFGQKKVAD